MNHQASNQEKVVITAIEARTPVGLSIEQSAAAIRAGVSGYREHPEYYPLLKDEEDDYLISAGIDLSIKGYDWQRLLQFIEPTFLSFMANAGFNRKQMEGGGLWLALPYSDPVVQQIGLHSFFLEHCISHFSLPKKLDVAGVQLGATGVIYLINKARQALLSGEREFIIIAGVDSYMLDGRLNYYDDQWRLKSDRNPMGFVPGEAAGLLLLETEAHAKSRQQEILVEITGVGVEQEVNPISGEKSSTGEGLSQAIEKALHADTQQSINWLYSDLNGESYRAYEWGVANSRLDKYFGSQLSHVHPADVMGDVGSATTAIHLGCISQAFQCEYADDTKALLFAANDKGQRAALSVSRPG